MVLKYTREKLMKMLSSEIGVYALALASLSSTGAMVGGVAGKVWQGGEINAAVTMHAPEIKAINLAMERFRALSEEERAFPENKFLARLKAEQLIKELKDGNLSMSPKLKKAYDFVIFTNERERTTRPDRYKRARKKYAHYPKTGATLGALFGMGIAGGLIARRRKDLRKMQHRL